MDSLTVRERHYTKEFGPLTEPILHSTDEKPLHIDVYQFPPSDRRPYWTLITGGMSDKRQNVPGDAPGFVSPRTEILLYAREPKDWMFHVLKCLAEMPFTQDTFLHWWHSVPNGMPMTPQRSHLTNFLFLPPYLEPESLDALRIDEEKVDVLWLVPITDSEFDYAVQRGPRELEAKLREKGLDPAIDENRGPAV